MKNLTARQVVTASSLMAGALQAALVQNIITDREGHEIYEQALSMLETSLAVYYSPKVSEAARELIEHYLHKFPHHDEL